MLCGVRRTAIAIGLCASLLANTTSAQKEPEAASTDLWIVLSPPSNDASTSLELAWEQYPSLELKQKVRRTRIALLSMAGVFAAGLITFSVSLTQCTEQVRRRTSTVTCTRAGEILEPMGRALLYGGAVGLLTSGILLAVRNKKLREQRAAGPRVVPASPSDR